MTAICNCIVVDHPSGEVWIPDGPCEDHRHAQRFTDTEETRMTASMPTAERPGGTR